MIKSLLGEDEEKKVSKKSLEKKEEKKADSANKEKESSADVLGILDIENEPPKPKIEGETSEEGESFEEIKSAIELGVTPKQNVQTVEPFEIERPIGQPKIEQKIEETPKPSESEEEKILVESPKQLELEKEVQKIEEELLEEKKIQEELKDIQNTENKEVKEEAQEEKDNDSKDQTKENLKDETKDSAPQLNIKHKDFVPDSKFETVRKTGLAWSAAIILFGSVVFMMVIGWFIDLLLGSQPNGLAGGIIVGSIIGFIQFFRTSSQIFKPKKSDFEKTSLKANYENSDLRDK